MAIGSEFCLSSTLAPLNLQPALFLWVVFTGVTGTSYLARWGFSTVEIFVAFVVRVRVKQPSVLVACSALIAGEA